MATNDVDLLSILTQCSSLTDDEAVRLLAARRGVDQSSTNVVYNAPASLVQPAPGREMEGKEVKEPFPYSPFRMSCPGCRHVVLFPPLDRQCPSGTSISADCPKRGSRVICRIPVVVPALEGHQLAVRMVAIGVVIVFVVWIIRVMG
jgi:hypothetical protein